MPRTTTRLSLALYAAVSLCSAARATGAAPVPGAAASHPAPNPAHAPLLFEENRGQAEPGTRFLAHTPRGILRFAADHIELPCAAGQAPITLSIAEARGPLTLDAGQPTGAVANYYLGRDPAHWLQGIALQGSLRYRSVEQGVALRFHGTGDALEYDLESDPGADPAHLALQPSAGAHFHLEADGSATLDAAATGCQPLRFHAPAAFQQDGPRRTAIPSRFALNSAGELSFAVGPYNHLAGLTIDPVVTYTTGIAANNGVGIAAVQVDAAGDLFVTGQTYASNYPITGGGSPSIGSSGSEQPFVSEFDPTGTKLLYSTYLPASGFNTSAAIALDASGNAYITGITGSTSFPTTSQNLGTCSQFCNTGFVVKLSPTGTILYSTLLGASQQLPKAILVDSAGSAYIAGLSTGPGLQTVNAFQSAYTGQ